MNDELRVRDIPAGEPHCETVVALDDLARLLSAERDRLVCVELLTRSRPEPLR